MPARLACLSLACAALCSSAGCSGAGGARTPSSAPTERDTALTHEECNLESPTAKATDANGDERPDIISVYEGGREVCRAVDINMDTIIDVFIYYDARGQERRRESGFDRDTRPDEIAFFEMGQLVRKERETNNDGKIDTWDYYQAGRLIREERDSTGDGFVDQWWSFPRPDQPRCAIVVTDNNGDGRPDPATKLDLCAEAGEGAPPPTPTATATSRAPGPAATGTAPPTTAVPAPALGASAPPSPGAPP